MNGRVQGFEPFFDERSKVLILGSFPSVQSRAQNFYYGNRQNSFWKILCAFFGEELPSCVQEKKQFLARRNIALWDMVQSCTIVGSADAAIRDYEVADLDRVLRHSDIKYILLNGGKAAQLYFRHYADVAIPAEKLPSTSPANTRPKEEAWHDALARAFDRT